MQPEDIARRDVAWDPATATLTVGGRSLVVTCDPDDNAALLRTYLDLVAEQRDVTLDGGVALRRDDVVVLAELLDLDDARLEGQLREILHLSGREAAELTRRLRRQRVASAAIGVGMLAVGMPIGAAVTDAVHPAGGDVAPASTIASVAPAPDGIGSPITVTVPSTVPAPAPAPVPAPVVVPVVASIPDPVGDPIPDPIAAPAPAAAPVAAAMVAPDEAPAEAPAPAPEAEVGYTVTYERDPDFVAPEGVDIGESFLAERDTP